MIDHRRPSFIQFSKPSKRSLDHAVDEEHTLKRSRPNNISEEDSDDKDISEGNSDTPEGDTPDNRDTLPPNDNDDDTFYDALEMQDDSVLYEWATPCWNVD